MIFSLRDSLRPTARATAIKGTGRRQFTALLLALLLGFLNNAAAAPSRITFAPTVHEPNACSGETAKSMLSLFMERAKGRRDGIIVAGWYLHPDGFAFQIPDGLVPADMRRSGSLLSAYRGVASFLDPSQEGNPFQTFFTLSITSEDKRLQTMHREDAQRLFSSQFERFSLISFAKVIVCDVDGIRLSFLTGRSPRLQVQQCMFVKNGKTYIATMVSENKLHSLPAAWRQFDTIYSTFFFLEDMS
jgi:hypothetical protein